jgi:hypothetical protein
VGAATAAPPVTAKPMAASTDGRPWRSLFMGFP